MPSNFDFLRLHRPELYDEAVEAERLASSAPRASCFHARFTLEKAVHWLYQRDPALRRPYEGRLGALVHEPSFREAMPTAVFEKARAVLMIGNAAAHEGRRPNADLAGRCLRELHGFLFWLSVTYTSRDDHPDVRFDPALVPPAAPQQDGQAGDRTAAELGPLQKSLEEKDALLRDKEAALAALSKKTDDELAALQAELKALKAKNEAAAKKHDYGEADTRRLLIDLLLLEAGWDVDSAAVGTEDPVTGMPSDSGDGFVDYVLWDDDGRPLAVVEAKATRHGPTKGLQQAKLYADCLEAKHGRRPILFCSNGYDHLIWDDARYPPRGIQGFLKKQELQRLLHRRAVATPLAAAAVDPDIAGRPFQVEGIRRVCETFEGAQRRALVTMATGTGKTRLAIALVDVLRRCNWADRVLFLADRNALVRQAKNAFAKLLPNANAIDLGKAPKDDPGFVDGADVVVSTYPTMMNRIDRARSGANGAAAGNGAGGSGGARHFGPGYFDLVIVDEAHRSTYKKYGAIFRYFDALMVGLTATPRGEVDRDTYGIFALEKGNPTFAYELDQAVEDRWLVPPRGIEIPFRFLREGIAYDDLPPEEQEEYEEKLYDEERDELPPGVSPAALNAWLFNADTVDRALKLLMEHGIKVGGGDRLGKTIVFARNHKHAEFIQERFDRAYPHLKGRFARVIDSHDDYAETLLDDFSDPKKEPTIALSVDMLDTGVDVPEVVNLVFFKPLRSRVKFNQMIGRGTRLCEDLFGPGQHKTHFLVFDLCSNFEFFRQKLPEADAKVPPSLTARIIRQRLRLVESIEALKKPDEDADALRTDLLDEVHAHVAGMNEDNFVVRTELETVHRYQKRERWEALTPADHAEITKKLAELPTELPFEEQDVKEFDLLCLKLQVALLRGSRTFPALAKRMREVMEALAEAENVPMVKAHIALIHAVMDESWWADVTLQELEQVRRKLRGLIPFIEKRARKTVYTTFADDPLFDEAMIAADAAAVPVWGDASRVLYRERVERHIREHEDHLAIAKLRMNRPLTPQDLEALEQLVFAPEVGASKEAFEERIHQPLPRFIRSLVGLDREAAKRAFGEFLDGRTLTAAQIRFIDKIIDILTRNGVMDPGMLYEPPFTDIHAEGLDGVFQDPDADQVIAIIRAVSDVMPLDEPAKASA